MKDTTSRRTMALGAALVGMTASAIQQSLLSTATPTVVDELGHRSAYGMVSGLYLVASVVTLPLAGALTDRLGARPMYLTGTVIFGLGTASACLAAKMEALLISRALQGLGAGLLVPAAFSIVALFDGERVKGRLFGLIGVIHVSATIVGSLWGGWATDRFGWRWALAATEPLILVSTLMAVTSMPLHRYSGCWWKLKLHDMFAPVKSAFTTELFIMAFAVGGLTATTVIYMPWALQVFYQLDATAISHRLIPIFLSAALGSAIGGSLTTRPWILTAGWIVVLLGTATASSATLQALTVAGILVGLGCGSIFPIILTRVQTLADPQHIASASSMLQFSRQIGAAVVVSGAGLWPAYLDTKLAAIGLLVTLIVVALGGLITSWRSYGRQSH
ncbi:MFS transporter [Trueperella pyogenes]